MNQSLLMYKPESTKSFLSEVIEKSGQNLTACYQCRRCAAGCSVGDETVFFTPDKLIRMIIMGDKYGALNNELVWKCVSCYTCGTRCPNDIQTGKITETLKKIAKQEKIKPLIPKVKHFHDSFFKSGVRWGRVNEMEFMGFYELKNSLNDFFVKKDTKAIIDEIKEQVKLGFSMLKLKRLHFDFQMSRGRIELRRLSKISNN